jgi:hypothetical protein
MTNNPICYPYLHGYLEQTLKGLSYDLVKEGLVDHTKQKELEKLINEKIQNANKAEREHSRQFPS